MYRKGLRDGIHLASLRLTVGGRLIAIASERLMAPLADIRVQQRGTPDTGEGEQHHAFCPDECDAAPAPTSLRCLESVIMNGQIASAVIAVAAVAVAGPNPSPRKP
jgi:hypothetical protein